MTAPGLDCVVIGHNDIPFREFAEEQKHSAQYSGAYHEIQTNSVLCGRERLSYMELLSAAVARATGTNPSLNVFSTPSLGVCYLTSFLARRGFAAEAINCFSLQRPRLQQMLADRPRAVAITTTYYTEPRPIIEICQFVRAHSPETAIVVGGPYVYSLHADVDRLTAQRMYRSIGADIYIMDSQGESTLSSVLACLRDGSALGRVPNLAYRDGKSFSVTSRTPENNELDTNAVDWRYFERDTIAPIATLRTARSCPFACSFCNYPTMAGSHVVTSLDVVESELRYLHDMGTRYLVFVDDTFNVPLPRFKALLRKMIENRFDFRWISFLRCSNVDDDAIDLMARSGCVGVFLGIESGDQTILNNMNKSAQLDRYRWGIARLKARGIVTFASIICGFPGETQGTWMNSRRFVEETQPTFFNVQLYYHDIQSPIAKKAAEFGIVGAGYSWKHMSMDWREAVGLAKEAFRSIRGSTPLTLYGFSLWSLPYLMSKGIDVDHVAEFGRIARDMLVRGFDDETSADVSDPMDEMAAVMSTSTLARTLKAGCVS